MKCWWWGVVALLGFSLAHPSSLAEGATGELKFNLDQELPAETPLEAWFEVKDLNDQPIQAKDCVCTLLVYKGQALASARPLVQMSLEKLEFVLTFPGEGQYTVVLLGRPRPGTKLQVFKLSYFLNVLAVR
ncbi:MAG: hypothetical protein SFU83_24790 [Meiothermus sp.]|nr:hypothetical protein [Meiothermus sp.]